MEGLFLLLICFISLVVFIGMSSSDTEDDRYECSNLPMTEDVICAENKSLEKRTSSDVFSHRLVFLNDGKMSENRLLNPCELKRFLQGYLRKEHQICVDVSNIKHQVHTPNNQGLSTYSIFFDIEDFTNYEEITNYEDINIEGFNNIEGLQVDVEKWCETESINQYARHRDINIGEPIDCLRASGSSTDSGRSSGLLIDYSYNISDEYALPLDSAEPTPYTNALSFLKGELRANDEDGDEYDSNFDFRPREAPDSISQVNTIFRDSDEIECLDYTEGTPTLLLPSSPEMEGSPMRFSGCVSKCHRVNPRDLLIPNVEASIDIDSAGIISNSAIPLELRENPIPDQRALPGNPDVMNVPCKDHYSHRPETELNPLPKLTCGVDAPYYTFIAFSETAVLDNPCRRDCSLNPDINGSAYNIGEKDAANPTGPPPPPMSAQYFEMPYGSTVNDYVVTCGNNYTADPNGDPASFVSEDGYACSTDGGNYSLQNCEMDSFHPPDSVLGYDYTNIKRSYPGLRARVPKYILDTTHGIICDSRNGYSGNSINVLPANDERPYYIPTGCFKHEYCNLVESTCFQEAMFFKFHSDLNVPQDDPDDNIIGPSPDFTPRTEFQDVVTDLERMLIGSYAMQDPGIVRGATDPNDPSVDDDTLLEREIEDLKEIFQITIISTKYIDSIHGHMITYRVTCDSDDCELMQNPRDVLIERSGPRYTDNGLPDGAEDVAIRSTSEPEIAGITLPPLTGETDETLIINFIDETSLEITISEVEDIKNIWLNNSAVNNLIPQIQNYQDLRLNDDDTINDNLKNEVNRMLRSVIIDRNNLENNQLELFLKAYLGFMEGFYGINLEPHADFICSDFEGIPGVNIAACSEEVVEPPGGPPPGGG